MITGVAIRVDGVVHSLPKPNRHHHVIRKLIDSGMSRPILGTQGFVDESGEFLDRLQAAAHVLDIGQIKELATPPDLYSEDLW